MIWHDAAPILIGGSSSLITMYNVPTSASKIIAVSNDGPLTCGRVFPDGM